MENISQHQGKWIRIPATHWLWENPEEIEEGQMYWGKVIGAKEITVGRRRTGIIEVKSLAIVFSSLSCSSRWRCWMMKVNLN